MLLQDILCVLKNHRRRLEANGAGVIYKVSNAGAKTSKSTKKFCTTVDIPVSRN